MTVERTTPTTSFHSEALLRRLVQRLTEDSRAQGRQPRDQRIHQVFEMVLIGLLGERQIQCPHMPKHVGQISKSTDRHDKESLFKIKNFIKRNFIKRKPIENPYRKINQLSRK